VYDANGQLLNPNLVDYRVPSFNDVPEDFHTVLVENEDGPGPYGVRGMGEGGLLSVAPSVVNALARFSGTQLSDLPLTPERVWRALKRRKSNPSDYQPLRLKGDGSTKSLTSDSRRNTGGYDE
jgi:CO/xanthine dehydrogenase Mo-binding subunit